MKIERKWLWLGGAVAGHGAALALGVPLGTLLIVTAVLVCPLMMFFGMRGMQHGSGGMAGHPGSQQARPDKADLPQSPTASPTEEAGRTR